MGFNSGEIGISLPSLSAFHLPRGCSLLMLSQIPPLLRPQSLSLPCRPVASVHHAAVLRSMVVSYTQEHVYRHPWHRVTAAAWRKFTDAPPSHILDVQTLSRRVDPRAGRLNAVRAIAGCAPPLPFLLRRLAASAGTGDVVLCAERTSVDAPARAMRVVSRNTTFRRLVDVEERCSYGPHPDRPDEWTLFRQETSIRCAPLAAVSTKVAELVERRCAESFLQNAAKGREAVERICESLALADTPDEVEEK